MRTEAIGRRGCRDVLLAISGDGYRSLSPPSTRTGLSTSARRMREYHVNLAVLRSLIAANPSVTFKLMLDGPNSGAYLEPLKTLANVLLIATSSSAGQTAFRYLPQKSIAGNLTRNPLRRRADSSFLTTQLFGAAAFAASDAEVVHAANEVSAGRAPSFLAYMIGRGFNLSRPFDFTADLGATQRLYERVPSTPPGPTNRAPIASPLSITTAEDTPVSFILPAVDLDLGVLTFTVGSPAHGTLSGTAPFLTYTPAANYNGPDSFTFSVSDGFLISLTVTVSITVTPVDDPPVTTASGTLAYTENDPPTAIAPALTVTDVDSTNLTGATVQVTGQPRGRRRPARADVPAGRDHGDLRRGHRHADAGRQRVRRGVPGRAARRDLRELERQPRQRAADRDVPLARRRRLRPVRDAHDHDRAGQRPARDRHERRPAELRGGCPGHADRSGPRAHRSRQPDHGGHGPDHGQPRVGRGRARPGVAAERHHRATTCPPAGR